MWHSDVTKTRKSKVKLVMRCFRLFRCGVFWAIQEPTGPSFIFLSVILSNRQTQFCFHLCSYVFWFPLLVYVYKVLKYCPLLVWRVIAAPQLQNIHTPTPSANIFVWSYKTWVTPSWLVFVFRLMYLVPYLQSMNFQSASEHRSVTHLSSRAHLQPNTHSWRHRRRTRG